MIPIVFVIITILAAGTFGIGSWYVDNFTGLQLENPPSSIQVDKWDEPIINYNLHSYETEQNWNNVNVSLELENSSGEFLKIKNVNHESLILGQDSERTFSNNFFQVINTEGYKLIYNGELIVNVNDNDNVEDNHPISITIMGENPTQPTFPINRYLEFKNFNSKSFSLEEGKNDIIKFQIESKKSETFDNIKIEVIVANSSGKYLKIEGTKINEILHNTGDLTGFIEIPIEAISSEGTELQYKVILKLSNDAQYHDVEILDIFITP